MGADQHLDLAVGGQDHELDLVAVVDHEVADDFALELEDGIDTFVFADGMIRVQTVVHTVQPVRAARRELTP